MSKETRTVHVKVTDGGSIKNASKGSDNLSKSLSSTGKVGGAVFSKLDSLSGGLLSSLRSMIPSIGGVSKSFRTLKMAIIGTGIGALVIGVVALTQAFKRSEAGQNKMAKMTAMLGAFTGQLLDKVADLGEFLIDTFSNPVESIKSFANLIKTNIVNRFEGLAELIPSLGKAITLLFDGEFSAAGKIATDAVGKVTLGIDSVTDSLERATQAGKDFVAETSAEVDAMARIADSRAKIDKDQRQLNIDRAKADAEISELRSKAENAEMFTAAERLEFTKQAAVKQEEIINREKSIIAEKLKNQLDENALGKSTKADLDAANALQVELIQKETSLNNFKKLNFARQKALSAEARTAAKKEAGEASEEDKAAFKKLQEDLSKLELNQADLTAQEKLDRARANHLKELEAMKVEGEEKDALKKQLNAYYDAEDEKLEQEKAVKEYEKFQLTKEQEALDFENQRAVLQSQRESIMGDELLSEEQKLKLVKAIREAETKIDDKVLIAKEKQDQRTKGNLKAMGLAIAQEAGIGKEVAMAQAAYQTYKNATDARTSQLALATPDAPIRAAIAMASEIGIGIMNVRNIAKTKIPRGGGGGSAPSLSQASAAVSTQAPDINVMGRSTVGERQINDSINSMASRPTRAYVVESEMASSQALARRVDDASSIG